MRTIDADALIEKLRDDAEHMEVEILKLATYAAINDIKHAPTVESERKESDWNLCVDRLPEKEGRYLITVDEDGRKDVSDDFFYFRADGTPSWYVEKNVIAWKPLPGPYRGEKYETD